MTFAQDSSKSKPKFKFEQRELNKHFPKFYPYLGVGIVNGERIGGIIQFHENFSAEASYGYIFGTGWSLTDPDNMASIGASIHIRDDIPVFFSFIYTVRYYRPLNSGFNTYNKTQKFFSVNAGYIDLTEIGMQFMGRAGLYFVSDKGYGSHSFFDFINIDIGLGYSF
jgi:hypothetical protein